jgi:general secretion pathway protein E
MEYLHVDPLKIDFAAVTEMMSVGVRHALPHPAGRPSPPRKRSWRPAEPRLRDWEPELARMLKREIKRVIANPVDIERYQVEFYNLAKSIKGANKTSSASAACRISSSWSRWARTRPSTHNDAHIVKAGGLALELRLRAARERHPHRAAARVRHRALSASTACCTRSTRSPPRCWRR